VLRVAPTAREVVVTFRLDDESRLDQQTTLRERRVFVMPDATTPSSAQLPVADGDSPPRRAAGDALVDGIGSWR
jgi:hypothetical protein